VSDPATLAGASPGTKETPSLMTSQHRGPLDEGEIDRSHVGDAC
jgi:hypothetical protein